MPKFPNDFGKNRQQLIYLCPNLFRKTKGDHHGRTR